MTIREFGNELLTSLLGFTLESVPGALGVGLSLAADGGTGCGSDAAADSAADRAPARASTSGVTVGPGPDGGRPRSVAAIGVAGPIDTAQWTHAQGPIWDAFRQDTVIVRPEPQDAAGLGLQVLPGLGPAAAGVLGAVFVPGEFGAELPTVFSVYLDRVPDERAIRAIDRYEPLAVQALAVVEYCAGEEQIARQMLQMTQYRRVIEQAKGLVMGALGIDAPGAFATLVRASQHFNIRLRTLAVALVEHVGGHTAEHPQDPELVVRPTPAERESAARIWAALSTSAILGPR